MIKFNYTYEMICNLITAILITNHTVLILGSLFAKYTY